MKVITLLNEKGGVGKTTIAVHAAMGLAYRGYRVVLVDGDPQGHATVRVGYSKGPGLYDLLVRDAEWRQVTKPVDPKRYGVDGEQPKGALWVVPSNVETRNIANSISEADSLAIRLAELDSFADVVIIDTSPTPSLLHGAFYTATDAILYPTKLTFTSFDGLIESITRRLAANEARAKRWGQPPIEVMGIIPVEYRANTNEQQANYERLREQFKKLVWNPIPQRTVWTESEGSALPVFNLEPTGEAAFDAWEIVDRIEEGLRVTA